MKQGYRAHLNLSSNFDPIFILIFPQFFNHLFQLKIQLFIGIRSVLKTRLKRASLLKKNTIYIITKFSLHHFLVVFLDQKWCFIERFINHTSSNLISKHVLIKTPKKKTILTTSLGTELRAYGHFNREQAKNKKY